MTSNHSVQKVKDNVVKFTDNSGYMFGLLSPLPRRLFPNGSYVATPGGARQEEQRARAHGESGGRDSRPDAATYDFIASARRGQQRGCWGRGAAAPVVRECKPAEHAGITPRLTVAHAVTAPCPPGCCWAGRTRGTTRALPTPYSAYSTM